jgi:dihydrofolate reductase
MSRKLIYLVATTSDGFIAREDGSFDWCQFEGEHLSNLLEEFPETFPAHVRPHLGIDEKGIAEKGIASKNCRFDTVIMGRATYEVGLREGITNPYAPLRQILVSKTMPASPDPAVELFAGDPVALVRQLKRENGGQDIWLCGGGKLAASLVGEIDELILKVSSVEIQTGIPLFDHKDCHPQFFVSTLRYYSNGFVLARYLSRGAPIAGAQ